jgi:hypothetical protein
MQNFTVTDEPGTDIPGYFQVRPAMGHMSDATEQAYLDQLKAVLDALAADAAKDTAEPARFPADELAARQQARAAAVASLRANAEADQTAQVATQKIGEIEAKYKSDLADTEDGPPKFEAEPDNSRFPGYFSIKLTRSVSRSPADEEYLKQVRDLLKYLAGEADKDQEALEPGSPRSVGHVDARQRVAERLRGDVNFVGDRRLTAKAATETLQRIRDDYDKAIENIDRAKLEIEVRPDARFDGDFKINVSEAPNPDDTDREHRVYVALVRDILRQLFMDQESDKARGYSEAIRNERQKKRKETADKLKSDADAVSKGRLDVIAAANAASTAKGRYQRDLELTAGTLFTVRLDQDKDQPFAVGVIITLAQDLLPPSNVVSPEKQQLYTAILAAQTVIKTVCARIKDGDDKSLCGRMFGARQSASASERAQLLLDAYMRKLLAIGELGLQGPNTDLAKVALDSLRNELVAHEGPRIKNSYVCKLGIACGIAAGFFLFFYMLITTEIVRSDYWQLHKSFFLAGTGAAIGTWMSFSIREVELSFDHLGVVEADLLDPAFRVLFVVTLTVTACLLFWTGVMNIEIGNLKTTPAEFGRVGTVALLVGLFCGLSERALATSVSGRAATFVKGISG